MTRFTSPTAAILVVASTLLWIVSPVAAQTYADGRYHVPTSAASQDYVCDQERTGSLLCTNFAVSDSAAHTFTALPSFVFGVAADAMTVLGRSLAQRASDVLQARDNGVKCDGSTDDTAALNTFFAKLSTSLSAPIEEHLPAGQCNFSGMLTVPVTWGALRGSGAYTTTLMYTGSNTTTDLVKVGNAGSPIGPGSISGFRIQSQTTMTAGWGLHLQNASRVRLSDLIADGQNGNGKLKNGMWFDQFDFITLDGWEARAQGTALGVSGPGTSLTAPYASNGPQYDFWATHGKVLASHVGVLIGGGVDNVFFDDTMDTNNDYNVVIDNSLSSFKNQEVHFGPQFVADQALNDDYLINDSLANRAQYCTVTIAGVITGAKTGNGININHWANCFVIVKSPAIQLNYANGIVSSDVSAYLSVDDSVVISDNGAFGISATSAWSRVKARGWIIGNTSGATNNVTLQ